MAPNVIVFGPTGGVASHAAQYAASKGSHITLAMRDTSKTIPGLSASEESTGKYTRVQADLTDPASIKSAATNAKAFSAFIYLVPSPSFNANAVVQALKDAGVKHVVFNSSFSVTDPVKEIPPTEFIPFAHGRVEIAMDEIFGEGKYVAVRPCYFASNTFMNLKGIKAGTVREAFPENPGDYVAPKDIGEVEGHYLVVEEDALPKKMDVCGAQVLSLREVLADISRAVGKDIKIETISADEMKADLTAMMRAPPPLIDYLVKVQQEEHEGKGSFFSGPRFEKGQQTVKELLGREPVTWQQWLGENKAAFA